MVLPGEILQAEHQLNRMAPADFQPSYYGFTTGRWQGNTLVTKTTGLRADTLIDTTGVPHSDHSRSRCS